MSVPAGGHGPATSWEGWHEDLAGGPVRQLSARRIRITERGVLVAEAHTARFGPDKANRIMLNRLRRIVRNEIRPAPEDLNFYAHELREYVRYRRRGWGTGLPADSDEAMDLWRQAHCGAIDDYGLTLHREDLLYHPDALPYIGEIPT